MAQIRIYTLDAEITYTPTVTVAGRIAALQADIVYLTRAGRITAVQASANYQPTAIIAGGEIATGKVSGSATPSSISSYVTTGKVSASVPQSSVSNYVSPVVVEGTPRVT